MLVIYLFKVNCVFYTHKPIHIVDNQWDNHSYIKWYFKCIMRISQPLNYLTYYTKIVNLILHWLQQTTIIIKCNRLKWFAAKIVRFFSSDLFVRPILIGRWKIDGSPDYPPKYSSITSSTHKDPKTPYLSIIKRCSGGTPWLRAILTAFLHWIRSFVSQLIPNSLIVIIVPSAFVSRIIGLARVRFVNKIVLRQMLNNIIDVEVDVVFIHQVGNLW